MLSLKGFIEETKESRVVLIVIEQPMEEQPITIPEEAKAVIREFGDVFLEDLPPRLPPMWDIQH